MARAQARCGGGIAVRLTKAEREEVVMLLRCAADTMLTGVERWPSLALYRASDALELLNNRVVVAVRLFDDRRIVTQSARVDHMGHGLLEAAQLIEEGVLP